MLSSHLLGLVLAILLVSSSVGLNYAFAQVPQRISTDLVIDRAELKNSRQIFKDFEKDFIFEGEVVKISGDLRTTVSSNKENEPNITETGIGGAKLKILTTNNAGEIITLVETVTSSGGSFDADWTAKIIDPDRPVDIFAVYAGSNNFQSAQSQHIQFKIRTAFLDLKGERGNFSVSLSPDPVILRTGYLARIDLEFHRPGGTSALGDVKYNFVLIQDAVKIREEKNNFAESNRNCSDKGCIVKKTIPKNNATSNEIFTHFFTTRSNNKITGAIFLLGIGQPDSFKPLYDVVRFTISPLRDMEKGVVMNTDKTEYLFEDTIMVKGTLPTIERVPIILQVRNPDGKLCVFQNLPSSVIDQGKFTAEIRVSQKQCEEPGKYRLIAYYGILKTESAFVINAPTASIDVINRNAFTVLRVNNAPFADSVYELRLTFTEGTSVRELRVPDGWFSHFNSDSATLTFFTDYNPVVSSSSQIFKVVTPAEPVHAKWFTVNGDGKVTATGFLLIQ